MRFPQIKTQKGSTRRQLTHNTIESFLYHALSRQTSVLACDGCEYARCVNQAHLVRNPLVASSCRCQNFPSMPTLQEVHANRLTIESNFYTVVATDDCLLQRRWNVKVVQSSRSLRSFTSRAAVTSNRQSTLLTCISVDVNSSWTGHFECSSDSFSCACGGVASRSLRLILPAVVWTG